MNRQQLRAGIVAGLFALALPVGAALAAGGSNGGASGGAGSGGSSSGGSGSNAGSLPIGSLTISNDDTANADYQRAQTAINGADYKTAADLLEKVLARQPSNPDVLNLMGFSERKLGEASDALRYYKKALDLQPTHIGANEY